MGSDGKVVQWLDACVYWVGDSRQLWRWWAGVALTGLVLLWWITQWGGSAAAKAPSQAEEGVEPVALVVPKGLSTGQLTSAAVRLQEFPWGPEAKKPVGPKASASGKAAAPPPRWQAQGTFLGDDGKRRLLVRFEGDKQPYQFLGVNQVLPNGWVLLAVDRFEVLVLDPTSEKEIQLPWADLAKTAQ